MISQDQIQSISGGNVVGSDGAKIGSVGQVYLDDQSGNAEWVTVKTGLFGTSETFVPIRDADVDGQDIRVPFDKAKVKDAPRMDDADQHLDHDQERKLYEYYSMDYDEGRQDTGQVQNTGQVQGAGRQDAAVYDQDRSAGSGDDRTEQRGDVGHDTSGPNTDEAMTRSEERLNVGTDKVETGRARLRKHIVTEDVSTTVPVSHEEVRVVTEPITEENRGNAVTGGDLTEEEHEVTLHAEQAVVNKETVPVERVKLDTETVTSEQEVTEQVRKEQIETDTGDANTGGKNTRNQKR